jgi:hypothetical protein
MIARQLLSRDDPGDLVGAVTLARLRSRVEDEPVALPVELIRLDDGP